ncbi:hypothetical protein [Dolichospermum phage Dfl-JY45]
METIRSIPAAAPTRTRPASHLDRSLLALVFAPRMTQTEAAEYAQGRKSAVASAVAAWTLAAGALFLVLIAAEAYASTVHAKVIAIGSWRSAEHADAITLMCVAFGVTLFLLASMLRPSLILGRASSVLAAIQPQAAQRATSQVRAFADLSPITRLVAFGLVAAVIALLYNVLVLGPAHAILALATGL